jgi:hypothetical protein
MAGQESGMRNLLNIHILASTGVVLYQNHLEQGLGIYI